MQIRALRALSDLSSETVNIPVMHTLTASSKEFLRKSWYVCTPPSVKNKTCKIKSQEAYLRVPEKRETSHTHFFLVNLFLKDLLDMYLASCGQSVLHPDGN